MNEVYFLLSNLLNSKNAVFWGTDPVEDALQRPLHSIKLPAWGTFSKHGIIGSFWFEDANGQSVMVKFWTPLCRRSGNTRDEQWFQQDGVICHTCNNVVAWSKLMCTNYEVIHWPSIDVISISKGGILGVTLYVSVIAFL